MDLDHGHRCGELGEPGIAATDVHHILGPLELSGEAHADRRVAFFINDHQDPKMDCFIDFNVRSGEALPFACESKTPYRF